MGPFSPIAITHILWGKKRKDTIFIDDFVEVPWTLSIINQRKNKEKARSYSITTNNFALEIK